MGKLKFVFIGPQKEVQVNSPYKQRFRHGVEVEVETDMAKVLRTHPHFKEMGAKPKKELTEVDQLKEMFPEERREYLVKKEDKLGWKKFQDWADDNFGVKDTSKEELFDEVLAKLTEVS